MNKIASNQLFELTNSIARYSHLAGLPVSSSGNFPKSSHTGI